MAIVAACRMPQRGLGELRTARFSSAERWIASSQPSSLPSLRRCCLARPGHDHRGRQRLVRPLRRVLGGPALRRGVRRHCGRGDHHLVRGNEPVVVEQTSPRPPLLGNRSFRCGRHRHPTLPRGPRHAAGHGDRADRVAGDHGRCLDGSLVALRRLRAACRSLSLPVGAGDARSSAPRGDLHDTVWSRAHVGPADDRVHLGPDARLRNTCVIPSLWTSGQRHKCFPVDIPTDTTDRAPRGESPTPMAYLAFEARSAVALMARYAARPHLRAHLGTSRSLDWSPTPPSAVDEATAGLQPWV